jgi:hypothetical protein
MNTYFLGLLQPLRKRKELKLPFFFGALKFEESYHLFSIKISIYQIVIEIYHLPNKIQKIRWVVWFNKKFKEESLIDVSETEEEYFKGNFDFQLLKTSFPGRNLLLRIDDNLIFHFVSLLNI